MGGGFGNGKTTNSHVTHVDVGEDTYATVDRKRKLQDSNIDTDDMAYNY